VNQALNPVGAAYYDFPMQQHIQGLPPQHPYYQQQLPQQQIVHPHNGRPPVQHPQQQQQQHQPQNIIYHGSPQRRFLSEGELLRQGAELSYARTNNATTVDNIRELAGSPQRGVYMWKGDTSPGFGNQPAPVFGSGIVQQQASLINQRQQQIAQQQLQQQQQGNTLYDYNDIQQHRSNPASPTQQQQQQQSQQPYQPNGGQVRPVMGAYHPALRGGVPVFPPAAPSPQLVKRKAGAATPNRPMSFVRALEMADSMEMTATGGGNTSNDPQQSLMKANGQQVANNPNGNGTKDGTPDRTSLYDTNYEISV
jgi:palmitoyltransferase ZDHHC5/8